MLAVLATAQTPRQPSGPDLIQLHAGVSGGAAKPNEVQAAMRSLEDEGDAAAAAAAEAETANELAEFTNEPTQGASGEEARESSQPQQTPSRYVACPPKLCSAYPAGHSSVGGCSKDRDCSVLAEVMNELAQGASGEEARESSQPQQTPSRCVARPSRLHPALSVIAFWQLH